MSIVVVARLNEVEVIRQVKELCYLTNVEAMNILARLAGARRARIA